MGEKIRVLVVDDSPFMRAAIKRMLETDPEIEVIDTAKDGLEAVEKVKRLKPDLVTMDVEMPRMDGITAVKQIMKESPVPSVMVSSLTQEGAKTTIEALEAGAVDYIPKELKKSSLDILNIKQQLLQKIKAIARTWRKKAEGRMPPPSRRSPGRRRRHPVEAIVIGVSTGGPKALQRIIPKLPADFPVPILIAQHMPPYFTKSLAERLDELSRIRVVEGSDGEEVAPGKAIIAPGGKHMKVLRIGGDGCAVKLLDNIKGLIYVPSADVLMEAAAEVYGDKVVGVILTGMGNDGLKGMTKIKEKGGITIAQDENSSVIFGMPKACIEAGVVDEVLNLDEIPHRLIEIAQGGGA